MSAKSAAKTSPTFAPSAPFLPAWTVYARHGIPHEARLPFGRAEIVVHRHMDEDAAQWFYSCHRYGVERVPIGDLGAALDDARAFAVVDLEQRLQHALSDLRAATGR